MKIVITGGHFAPAAAVMEELNTADVLFIGRKYAQEGEEAKSLEYQYCQENNIKFFELRAGRFQRKITRHTIPSLLKSPKAVISARKILAEFRPDVVLVFGGYIALPVAVAARTLGIPIVVHEQTLAAGVANKLIGKFANRVCISFIPSAKYFPKNKTIMTGNPIRTSVFEIDKKQQVDDTLPILYVTGGSTGAHAINVLIEQALPWLLESFTIIHQTGDTREYQDFERLSAARSELSETLKKRYILKKFVNGEEIGWIYKNADVVVGRSGINTVCELLVLAKKALLIPLPHGQKNEQFENAKLYASTGLGTYIDQNVMTGDMLLAEVVRLNKIKLNPEIFEKAQRLVHRDAAQKIVKVVKMVYEKNQGK